MQDETIEPWPLWDFMPGQVLVSELADPDSVVSGADAGFWPARLTGSHYLSFSNLTETSLFIHGAYREDLTDEFIGIRPALRVSPGYTLHIDMTALIANAAPGEFTSRFWPEIGVAMRRMGGRWEVVQP